MSRPDPDITHLLHAIADGDEAASERLLPVVYDQLRRLAHKLTPDAGDVTLQPTALVHDAYLRLFGGGEIRLENRRHFFGAAARAMRRILIERARKAARPKHGGDRQRLELDSGDVAPEAQADELLALDEALGDLEALDARKHEIVMLRYFAGRTIDETAACLGVSPRTVADDWSFTRVWLRDRIRPTP